MKKTVVLGASTNTSRYSYQATKRLVAKGHEVVPIGIKKGAIDGIDIINDKPELRNVDTITLYLGAPRQVEYYDYILKLQPKRIIFNPGTENPELIQMAQAAGIESVIACTLVMLASDNY